MRRRAALLGTSAFVVILSFAISLARPARAGGAPDGAADTPTLAASHDDLQRSYRTDKYLEVAESGADRGQNIYWHKCWACHNKYQQAAPQLEGLFQHPALITGVPVNEENVAAHIKKGGPGMPSFGTTLSNSDVADVVSYLHSDKCCVEGESLPSNPWYRSEKNKWTVQTGLSGGATGTVRVASGDSPEGVMVQLIAPNGVRTTVYTNEEGKYEFPEDAGWKLHPANRESLWNSSRSGAIRSRSTAPQNWKTLFWSALPKRGRCRRRRKWNRS